MLYDFVMEQDGVILESPEMEMLRKNKQDGYNYRYRRHFDWDENYELYRDKVIVNRLTQRQSVNLPLMKSSVRTLLKDVDDMPVLYFENLDNDKQAEFLKNEYWKLTVEYNKMDLQDIIDKRQVFLCGRSFDQWQVVDGWIKQTVQDPYDILVQRYCDPFNVHSSRFLIHTNIFVPLAALALNKDYDQQAIADMQNYYKSQQGLLKSTENQRLFIEKQQRLADMGLQDVYSPVLGETYLMLTLHFVYRNDEKDEQGNLLPEQIFLYVEADNMRILMKKRLEEVIGETKDHFFRNHFPYVTWADDLERQDFWSDGVADIIRTPNKILNAWFSQMVENRTLRGLGMHYYNSNMEGFNPQTMEPIGWGWYPIPVPANGDIRSVVQTVDVPDLSDSLEEMNFVVQMIEKATGATAVQQGVPNQKQVTLGEVQLQLGEAKERVKGMSKFYTPAWKERGIMFTKMIEAAGDKLDIATIYKKGRNSNNVYKKDIAPNDFMTPSGYNVRVWSQDEKQGMDTDALNKLNAVKANMPNNKKLTEIFDRKLLEFADLKPEEVNEVMQEQEEMEKQAAQNPQAGNKAENDEKIAINYKDAPADIQRQMEKAAGFTPSTMGSNGAVPGGQPPPPGMPQVPPTVPAQGGAPSQHAAMPVG